MRDLLFRWFGSILLELIQSSVKCLLHLGLIVIPIPLPGLTGTLRGSLIDDLKE
jgi:hypothetical protein